MNGDPGPAGFSQPKSALDRLLERRVFQGECWIYTGSTSRGYGMLSIADRLRPVHRVSYEIFVGPIPDGLQLDHLCRQRACFNPAHLEPVTQAENIARGQSWSAVSVRTGVCIRGHALTDDNVYLRRDGGRQCRECRRSRDRRRWAALREEVAQ